MYKKLVPIIALKNIELNFVPIGLKD